MDGQVKLTGLNLSEPRKLTPPSQLLAQTQTNPTQPEVTDLPQDNEVNTKSELQKNDTQNISNIASSAAAGVMGISSVVKDLGTIGESMRAMHVQNSMSELQDRSYSDTGFGRRNNSYNDYGYDADFGATEFIRRRGRGRIEFSPDRRFGKIESNEMISTESRMAATNIAKGTFQGAKYGVIIGGVVSSAVNAYKVLTGKEKGSDAMGTVAADTITAGVSGAGGALTGGLASVGLASIGLAGPVGMAFAVGLGAVGAIGGQMLMTKTGLYDSIKEKVKGVISK